MLSMSSGSGCTIRMSYRILELGESGVRSLGGKKSRWPLGGN